MNPQWRDKLPSKRVSCYDTKLHLVVRPHCKRSGGSSVVFHCHHSDFHSDPEGDKDVQKGIRPKVNVIRRLESVGD